MNIKQAATRWEVSDYEVKKICRHLGISTRDIPDDTIPVYLPDKRYKRDPHRFYVFVLDVIINSHLELEGIDYDITATCVNQLRNAGLIVLKYGRAADSVDYHDYMISANRAEFYSWKDAKMKNKIEMITPIISSIAEGITAAGKMMAGVAAV